MGQAVALKRAKTKENSTTVIQISHRARLQEVVVHESFPS